MNFISAIMVTWPHNLTIHKLGSAQSTIPTLIHVSGLKAFTHIDHIAADILGHAHDIVCHVRTPVHCINIWLLICAIVGGPTLLNEPRASIISFSSSYKPPRKRVRGGKISGLHQPPFAECIMCQVHGIMGE